MSPICLLITTFPSDEEAKSFARLAVENGLAACIQIQAPCTSIYQWEGKIEEAQEYPVHIKTTQPKRDALKKFILEQHAYQVPEIICIDLDDVETTYAEWAVSQTNKENKK
jgi:periplasmic divalent cation tolerance protein